MRRVIRSRALARIILAAVAMLAPRAGLLAQLDLFPHRQWRTVETPHFRIHYTADLEEWTLPMAARIESVRDAVAALVGNAPRNRTTIVVVDPNHQSNGSAWPFLNEPGIIMWPTPPGPNSSIGEQRGFGEILSVHEFGHIAHLTRPSRSPWRRLLWRILPVHGGPVALKAPRWVDEGYATFVEGRLTGTGRPHRSWLGAILREWALESALPTYSSLNNDSRFFGGSMAYLAGSAFLEWLAEQKGDSSLVHLWRRMSARVDRSFDESFIGVYGDSPSAMYGRFTVSLTERALAVRRAVTAGDSTAGERFQRLTWNTGDPALSPDGSRIAVQLSARDRPSRIVIWNTAAEPPDRNMLKSRAKLLERDPEDVLSVLPDPFPRKPVATLYDRAGRGFFSPRFLPDGKRLLVVHETGTADGGTGFDLYEWDSAVGAVRRITHEANITDADPARSGQSAIATRCDAGRCDLVTVDIRSGRVTMVARGSPTVVYRRPRWKRDGRGIVSAVQRDGRWRVAAFDSLGAEPRLIDPDDGASRADPAPMPDGQYVVVSSDRGGIRNLELLDLSGIEPPRALTRITSAAIAPDVDLADSSVFFLALHSRGFDVNRIATKEASAAPLVAADSTQQPAAQRPPLPTPEFAVGAVSPPRAYGVGPHGGTWIFGGSVSPEGSSGLLGISVTDPIDRLGILVQGAYGEPATWRGGSLAARWRGSRPTVTVEGYGAVQRPSREPGGPPRALDAEMNGGSLILDLDRSLLTHAAHVRLGGTIAALTLAPQPRDARTMGILELRAARVFGHDRRYIAPAVGARVASGETYGQSWQRYLASGSLRLRNATGWLELAGSYGEVSRDAPAFEQFAVGGTAPLFFDPSMLSQRIAMPAMPLAVIGGRSLATLRVTVPFDRAELYYWTGSAGEHLVNWHRVIGADASYAVDALPFTHLPGARIMAGIAYSMDAPFKYETRAYVSLGWRP